MIVQKIKSFDLTCPHCGAKIMMSFDEYMKIVKETQDFCGATITCQRENKDGKNRDIEYVNIDCPICGGYIPAAVSDFSDSCDADNWGFVYSKHCKPSYGSYEELTVDDYLNKWFNKDAESESSELDENSEN